LTHGDQSPVERGFVERGDERGMPEGRRAAGAGFHCASGHSSSGPPHVVQRSPCATMAAALAL
jgi:hypothetical protein